MTGYLGRGEPGATVKVHVHGIVIRDVGVDGAGNWATYIGRQAGGRRIEAQQYRVGRPWSGWVGTNVVNKEEGLVLRITLEAGNDVEVNQMGGGRRHRRIF